MNMEMSRRITLAIFSLVVMLAETSAKSSFRGRLPNGFLIPHPCGPAYVWRGVGHQDYQGGGTKNKFGVDFAANNLEWTEALCQKDSDEDGVSNGEELGDPDCTWVPGSQPNRTTGLSNPGVCEPLNSTLCQGKNDFVNCEDLCHGVRENGVFRQTVTLSPPVTVPVRKMIHKCMAFALPQDGDYHMIAASPQIIDTKSIYHITVKGCLGDYQEAPGTVFDCYVTLDCVSYLFQWTKGDDDICFPSETGFRVGNHATAFKRAVLEVRLYNALDTERQDASGVNLFFTPNRRPHDAGLLVFGQWNFNIPPQRADYNVSGGCSGGCTSQMFSDTIYVTAAFNHLHYAGVKAVSQRIVGNRVDYIAYDEYFAYDNNTYHSFNEPIQINPGDRLNMECYYDTMSRNVTSRYGFDTNNDEMCYGYLMYYPRENDQEEMELCQSFGDIDTCDLRNEVVKGCNTTKLDFNDPDNVPHFNAVEQNCEIDQCLEECMALLKTVKRHPCYSGSFRNYLLAFVYEHLSPEPKLRFLSFWLKVASCDREFAIMELKDTMVSTGGATWFSGGRSVLVLFLAFVFAIISL